MLDTRSEIAVAIVVVVVILIALCVFIGLILYYGCGFICCCHNEKYDVCEREAEERAKKSGRSADRPQVDGPAEVVNPLDRLETSGVESVVCPLTPLDDVRDPTKRTVAHVDVYVADENEVTAFGDDKVISSSESVVEAAQLSAASVSVATPITTSYSVQLAQQESSTAPPSQGE